MTAIGRKQLFIAWLLFLVVGANCYGSSFLYDHLKSLLQHKVPCFIRQETLFPARMALQSAPGTGFTALSLENPSQLSGIPEFLQQIKDQAKKGAFQWHYQIGNQSLSMEDVEIDNDRRPRTNR